MLGNMLFVLLLVFEAPVTGVTKMGKLWFLLIFLLWVIDKQSITIKLCLFSVQNALLLYDKHN